MLCLHHAPRHLFFTGKGGVGKTSLACACALWLAEHGRRVLLVSTDPASNVGQVFGVSIGNQITALPAAPGLSALEIDPPAAAAAYRERMLAPVRGVLPDAVVAGIAEQLSGACTTEIAAFDEFTALLTDGALTAGFDHIVFDTAPTGHTIRLLQLPGAWSEFLDNAHGDASCLGPLAALDKQREQYQAAVATLTDPARTRLVRAIGLPHASLVVNALMPAAEAQRDPLAAAVHAREQAALAAMPETLASLPRDTLPLLPDNLVGLDALRALLAQTAPALPPAGEPTPLPAELAARSLGALVDDIAADGHGLVMLMGKGGVGKTTLAAAVAAELARRGLPVHLTTSDPAAHLSDTLAGSLPGLTVSRIDPVAETARYRQHVLDSKGAGLDADARALLEEDLRSPCTEEIAVFQAFSRIIREAGRQFVVMDTAPTGHTLLLLDATGAYHREVARQMGDARYTTPMMLLQDPKRTKALIVTLAETTPVLEAAALQADLRRAGIEPWAWLINQSVAAAMPSSALLQQRARHELTELAHIAERHAGRLALIPLLAEEPVGPARLYALTHPESGA